MLAAMRCTPAIAAAAAEPPVSGYVAWYDASDTATITSSGGAVSQWDDKSGNGHHVVQATEANKPSTAAETINSLNVLTFGTDDWLAATTLNQPGVGSSSTWFFVLETTAATTERVLVGPNTDGTGLLFINLNPTTLVSKMVKFNVADYPLSTNAVTAQTPVVLTHQLVSGTSYAYRLDGVDNGSGSTAVALGTGGHKMCIGSSVYVRTKCLTGKLGELIRYDSALSSGDMTSVEDYLSAKWGTP